MRAVTCSIFAGPIFELAISDLEHPLTGQELRLTSHMKQQLGNKKTSFVVEIKICLRKPVR